MPRINNCLSLKGRKISIHSKISVYSNFNSRTGDCIPSCKTIDFSTNYKTFKDISDQFELTEQPENSTVYNAQNLKPSTSNPSCTSEQTFIQEKSSKPVKHKLFPFSSPEIFDSKFMTLLTKQDLVSKKIKHAIEEDRKHDIALLGNYYKPYINNLHVNGGCLYFDGRLVIPACLRTTMLHRLHEAHPSQFAMKSPATLYIWWPKIYREIQAH